MPTYRYEGSRDKSAHTVVASSYERDHTARDGNIFTFFNPTYVDGVAYGHSVWGLSVISAQDIEIVEQ